MKTLAIGILIGVVALSASTTNYSTVSVVTLVGGKIAAEQGMVHKWRRHSKSQLWILRT